MLEDDDDDDDGVWGVFARLLKRGVERCVFAEGDAGGGPDDVVDADDW